MKIKFLFGSFNPYYDIDKDLEEITDDEYQSNDWLDKTFYNNIKTLELNQMFEKEVTETRRILHLPENGYQNLEEYIKKEKPWLLNPPIKVGNTILSAGGIEQKSEAIILLSSKFDLPSNILEQIEHIVYANYVIAPPAIISNGLFALSEDDTEDENYWNFQIYIFAPVTKNELITYIENNWKSISSKMSKLKPSIDKKISKRDMRIVELREKENMTFKTIANKIIKEFNIDNFDGNVNEDSVKTAYRRAKLKISSILKTPQRDK